MGRKRKSDLEKYLTKVASGKVVSSRRLKQLSKRMLVEIRDGYKEWRFDLDAAERPVNFIERYCCIPSGKIGQPFLLEDYEKAIVESIFGFVDKDGNRRFQEALIFIGRKNGKALSLDTPIPTPYGWKTMGDIHTGDVVFGCDGKPANVLVESQIFDRPMYAVTFEDGEIIKASADHIWSVETKHTRQLVKYEAINHEKHRYAFEQLNPNGTKDITTEGMFSDFKRVRADGKGVEYKYRVPMNAPVEYKEQDLLIDPYTFGVWLGDGTSTKGEITCAESDIADMKRNIESFGHTCDVLRYPSNISKAPLLSIDHMTRREAQRNIENNFKHKLRVLDVYDNKHIPREYLQASVEQRIQLLQGLMDTDGSIAKNGQCTFSQKGTRMLDDMLELLSSLGIKATYRTKDVKCNGKSCSAYEIQFFTDKSLPCFRMQRKADRLKDTLAPRMRNKSIVNIERIENEPSKCIAIDNEDHLYLAGRRYTATHNTSLIAAIELYMLMADHEGAPQIYNVASSKDQASLAYGAARKMVAQSKKISKRVRKGTVVERDSDGLICDFNMGYISVLSSQTKHLDGLDVHLGVIDELSAIENRDLYDLVKQGMAARDQPLLLTITTNGFTRNGIFDAQYNYACGWLDGKVKDDRFIAFIYELDSRDEWEDEKCWKKANPGLGTVKKLAFLRNAVKKAKQDPEYLPTVLTKDFNIPENNAVAWLTFDEAVNEETFEYADMGFRYGICGFDASDTIDLTSAQMLMMRPDDDHIYERSMYWIPEDTIQADIESGNRHERDFVPYQQWISRGLLRTVPGNKIDKRVLLEWLEELKEEDDLYTYAIGFDPWHMDDSTCAELESFVGKERAVKVRQGVITLSQPMKQLKADYAAHRLVDNHNPINEWCRMNVSIKIDTNGNIQPVKKLNNPRFRIDGFAAELDAYVVLNNLYDDYMQIR